MAFYEDFTVGQILEVGTPNGSVSVLARDASGLITRCKCATGSIPSAVAGYAKGCILMDTTSGAISTNTGTTASCTFVALSAVTAGSVNLAAMASGVAPSHVVKYAGKITWSGSGTSLATTVTGVAATDIVVCSFLVSPTQAAYVTKIVPTLNTITITLSAANTSNDAQISYVVYRAAA